MSKRQRRYGRKPSKRFAISDAFLYGLTRGLTRDRYDRVHRDAASGRKETNDTSDTLDLAGTGCRCRKLVRKLYTRIFGEERPS